MTPITIIKPEDQKRFFAKIERTPTCWNWNAGRFESGYGAFGLCKKLVKAHRVSFKLHKGEIPEGLMVLHSCDNRRCVNPDHLFAGTHQDNMEDRKKKGRAIGANKGEAHHLAKLSTEDVLKIRKAYEAGYTTHRELAAQFNVSDSAIGLILNRTNWKHLP